MRPFRRDRPGRHPKPQWVAWQRSLVNPALAPGPFLLAQHELLDLTSTGKIQKFVLPGRHPKPQWVAWQRSLVNPALAPGPFLLAQHELLDLAGRGFRQLPEPHRFRAFEAGQV